MNQLQGDEIGFFILANSKFSKVGKSKNERKHKVENFILHDKFVRKPDGVK